MIEPIIDWRDVTDKMGTHASRAFISYTIMRVIQPNAAWTLYDIKHRTNDKTP